MKLSGQERSRSGWCHLSGLGGLLLPLCNFLFPLILWSLWRGQGPFVESHGREAVNFQFSMVLLGGCFLPLEFFVVHRAIDPIAALSISLITAAALVIYGGVLTVRGAAAAFRGESFRYPHALRVF